MRAPSTPVVATDFFAASSGQFKINPMWSFGWDVMVQSDNSFANTYDISGYSAVTQTSTAYLTGLNGRNYFDLRAFYFDVQSTLSTSVAEKQQPIIHPTLDYSKTFDRPVAGGEVNLNMNVLSLTRREEESDIVNDRYRGVKGSNTRLTTELEWQRTLVTTGGLLLTPLVAARGDVNFLDVTAPVGYAGPLQTNGAVGRYMLTAGLEARYPIQFQGATSSHIVEPIGQIFVRPDEQYAGGLPNEDAQSFVFDASILFERDKFSGYDRIEGGTRANLGVRYTGTFDSGRIASRDIPPVLSTCGAELVCHAGFGECRCELRARDNPFGLCWRVSESICQTASRSRLPVDLMRNPSRCNDPTLAWATPPVDLRPRSLTQM